MFEIGHSQIGQGLGLAKYRYTRHLVGPYVGHKDTVRPWKIATWALEVIWPSLLVFWKEDMGLIKLGQAIHLGEVVEEPPDMGRYNFQFSMSSSLLF